MKHSAAFITQAAGLMWQMSMCSETRQTPRLTVCHIWCYKSRYCLPYRNTCIYLCAHMPVPFVGSDSKCYMNKKPVGHDIPVLSSFVVYCSCVTQNASPVTWHYGLTCSCNTLQNSRWSFFFCCTTQSWNTTVIHQTFFFAQHVSLPSHTLLIRFLTTVL